MTWQYVRVRPEAAAVIRDTATGVYVALDPRRPYRSDDQIVLDHPEMFVSDTDLAREHLEDETRPIERATRAPGERRGKLR